MKIHDGQRGRDEAELKQKVDPKCTSNKVEGIL